MSGPILSRNELTDWSRYIHEICGVFLDDSKGYLIEARLGELLRETCSVGFSELLVKVRSDLSQALRCKVIDAITTNETSFFRDAAPFDLLRNKLLPELLERRRRSNVRPAPIRIWSAACSTGQEAYSTVIVLKEMLGDFSGYDIRILGTDISDQAIAQASYAHFNRLDLERGLTLSQWSRYFEPVGDRWKIRDELRAIASFRRLNLLEPFSFPAPFDLIFCRNVAIYFTEADKIRLFKNLGRTLDREGALIIGATESIANLCPEFEPHRYLRTVFYRRKPTLLQT
ncbi:MAG: protein-glutamate O-methyltransferase CheR [Candidatus Contendobacter sp.]|jgi:chemotaxis protein methyltransferase CheR|nr:protein-glutamate O-methyltransferase CheR [Gammaproteobacteria bacterium]MCC8994866.1 protein-glutamate O-methyltransferase CheR [Candidatus Contendobacter sp.]